MAAYLAKTTSLVRLTSLSGFNHKVSTAGDAYDFVGWDNLKT
jgi:hypothetical protein